MTERFFFEAGVAGRSPVREAVGGVPLPPTAIFSKSREVSPRS